ncbi:filamentous hemagglutinin N-terminal domain-containing protein [Phormidium tenue FACHB-886]|nr:filamentous hemagglutinin N-terminal domain-containing protein [Phormidium tenue FACHB-886]
MIRNLTQLAGFSLILKLGFTTVPVRAQVMPDETLGNERSRVTSDVLINGSRADRLEGGASRGSNLFHSFREFNVGEGQRLYFHNPAGITNIFSRVTGTTPSQISGMLGVDGAANLFLLNPNGIVFGPNARLDVSGSFLATTANAFQFGSHGFFSATSPEQSSLLAIDPSALLFNQIAAQTGTITNAGRLQVGQDLTLTGRNLELQGQLWAGNHLTLQAQDTVRIQDSLTAPVIAAARGELWVQGNQVIDIFALNHSQSGLFSGGDMILRSAHPVGGDAHYWSGGNFRIEQLNGELGNLFSPFDPVIRSLGDVSFNNYEGASLHIIAGGSVNLGTAVISEPETSLDRAGYLRETLALSNGTPLSIDGSRQATLDIRAGVSPEKIASSELARLTPELDVFFDNAFLPDSATLTPQPTRAEIVIGDVFMVPPDGLVYLTNQYSPQANLPPDSITITGQGLLRRGNLVGNGIDARGFAGNGSTVIVDARGDILLSSSFIDTSSDTENAGRIALIAGRDIILNPFGSVDSSIKASAEAGQGGTLTLTSGRNIVLDSSRVDVSSARGGSLSVNAENIYLFGSTLNAEITGTGNGSPQSIALNASGNIRLEDSSILAGLDEQAEGNSGSIVINTNTLTATRSSVLHASTAGQGNAGNIAIYASGRVSFDRGDLFAGGSPSVARSNVSSGAIGNGGDIVIRADSLYLVNGGRLETNVEAPIEFLNGDVTPAAQGNAGNIDVAVQNEIVISGQLDRISGRAPSITGSNAGVFPNSRSSGIFNLVDREAIGNGGTVRIDGGSLSLVDGGQIAASSYGQGDAGEINLDIQGAITLGGTDVLRRIDGNRETTYLVTSAILNQIGQAAQGNSGGMTIRAGSLAMTDVSELSASTFGRGNAGNLSLQIDGDLALANLSNIRSVIEPGAIGKGGNIEIQTESLSLTNGAQIVAGVFRATDTLPGGQGIGGRIDIDASESVNLSGVSAIELPFPAVNPLNFSSDAPLVPTTSQDRLQTAGISSGILTITEVGATGQARDISVDTGRLRITDGGVITAQTENRGNGGNIWITANALEALAGGQIITNTSNAGRAGNIVLNVRDSITLSGTDPAYTQRLREFGRGPIANVNASSGLFANTETNSTGDGGRIALYTDRLRLTDRAQITSSTSGQGNTGSIEIRSNERISLTQRSGINSTVNRGAAGNSQQISLQAPTLTLSGGSQISAATNGTGRAGDILIRGAERLSLSNSTISASARTERAGSLTVDATNFVQLEDGSSISVEATNGGTAGDLSITTGQLTLTEGSRVTVSSPTGRAGNLTTTAAVVALNNGELSATTGISRGNRGANIRLNDLDLLLLGHQSQIQTNATRSATGGNISIDSEFIVAAPVENSDITANAGAGDGGRVNITAQGVFGIDAQPELTPGSDITATSEQGVQGIVTINQPDTDPSRGLTELPAVPIDAANQIASVCPTNVRQADRFDSFIVSGRGGLPLSPTDLLSDENTLSEWVTASEPGSVNAEASAPVQPIVEAQGWVVDAQGKVVLVSQSAPRAVTPPHCQQR